MPLSYIFASILLSSKLPCPRNVFCGRLMCENFPAHPVLSTITKVARSGDINGHICKTVSYDFGSDVPDPGYVAEGTLCAEGKVIFSPVTNFVIIDSKLNVYQNSYQLEHYSVLIFLQV